MSDIFLVTSAIHGPGGKNGQLTAEQRIDQTMDTANSIRQRVPDAVILLLEGGLRPLDVSLRQHFLSKYTDILDFTQHSFIQFAHENRDAKNQEITVIKGPCESYKLRETCKLLTVAPGDRIYKLSGRYRLSDSFDLNQHRSAEGKYLMKAKDKCLEWYSYPQKLTYCEYQYSTRLYSFCGSLLNTAIRNYDTINKRILELYAQSEYMDLEHMTYLVYNQNDIAEASPIGVQGAFAEAPDWKIDE